MQRTNHIKAITCCLTSKWHRKAAPAGRLPGHTLTTLLLLLLFGTTTAFAQSETDYSGVYYIGSNGYKSNNTSDNYYLCPTEGWCYYDYTNQDDFTATDNGQPFLTTYQCRNGVYNVNEKAVWIVEKHPTQNYYYIKRAFDGKYIVFNGQIRTTSNADRMRVHLEALVTPNDNALFIITPNGTAYNIQAKADPNAKYWTVNGGNKNALTGQSGKTAGPTGYANTAGIIGIYQTIDGNSNFYFEKATVDRPTITNNFNGTFTITAAQGATIYYTTDGTTPTTSTATTGTTTVNVTQTASMTVIKAIAKGSGDYYASVVATYVIPQCAKPVITAGDVNVTITCATEGATIHYTTDGTPATTSSATYTAPFAKGSASTFRAIATAAGYVNSHEAILLPPTEVSSSSQITNMSGNYILADNFTLSASIGSASAPFTGIIDGNLITRTFSYPLVAYAEDATIKNVILKDVAISGGTNVGAVCNEARGASRIYNCGVLGTSTISGSGYVGSIVGLLDGTSRVINCYSFATVTGGTIAAGIVGNNNQASTQSDLKTIVVNCMFYGDITGGTNKYPVYGGNSINNDSDDGINPYCYYRKNATFTPTDYNRSWPAEEKNLTRFEYYRSVLNSNRKLCTWWVNGTDGTAPTDEDIEDVGIAKWVLDPSIAPYPILKPWGKYPSIINPDPENRFDPSTKTWLTRSTANEWEGKSYNTLTVIVQAGSHNNSASDVTKYITITDMDTLNHDYGYYKIQLPYYNEVFGNPNGATHEAKYGKNYTDQVVTGWMITSITTDGTVTEYNNFVENWETGYNFADRHCTNKDLYGTSGRVFAQGGYYYIPQGVSGITITAKWGKAIYLANRGYSIDRVNVTNAGYKADEAFASAGTIESLFHGQTVYDDLQNAIKALDAATVKNGVPSLSVYDQAIVLIGNHQVKNGGTKAADDKSIGYNLDNNWHPFTIMSADLDFDNEPDNCLQFQFRENTDRPGIQPIRFDFLPVIELGLAVRHNNLAYAIGVFIPQGHFEITETAFMRLTQFEWDCGQDGGNKRIANNVPVILNGGEFDQLSVRYNNGNRTGYFLLGGNLWFHRFAPGTHPNSLASNKAKARLCAVNAIGGDFPEFYLSGLYRADITPRDDQGNPHCYIDGGNFGSIYGAGYEKIKGSVTFKINHALITEFYGGGINGSNPVGGNIDVTIDNSLVAKYCGGPKVGDMTGKTVTTHATGTTFDIFFGGGNGGNSYYRELQRDGDLASSHIATWTNENYNWDVFTPLGVIDDGADNKGYHAEYEFEVFNQSNGVTDQITQRGFIKWIQFGLTKTGNVSNTLTDCIINTNFYGGGNLGTVDGDVTSTLVNTTVYGNAYGAGYSATIPTFQVHDKSTVQFPSITAGVITDGSIGYDNRTYEWTNEPDTEDHDAAYMKAHPTYSKQVNGETKWYCYTWNSLENLGVVTGNTILNIQGNTLVLGNVTENNVTVQSGGVFGGGDASGVDGDTEVKIDASGQKNGYTYNTCNVFGGGNKADVLGNTSVELTGSSKVQNNVYGGGNLAGVNGSTTVNIKNGTVINDVYGGGMKGNVDGAVTVYIGKSDGSGTVSIGHDVYGGGKLAHTNMGNLNNDQSITTNINTTQVYLNPGATIGHDVYGGGRGEKPTQNNPGEAIVYGDVSVFQYGAVLIPAYDSDGLATSGRIFGCNNVNGTPKGHVLVDVEGTTKYPSSTDKYDLAAVYGGGNEAEFFPYYHEQDNSETTEVVINGCNIVSIHSVYGGGNAASTPATDVKIRGAKEIEFVYGGGNGAGTINGEPNPGANVGYKYFPDNISGPDQVEQRSSYKYGSGLAVTEIYGGTIHYVYGGSNTKGNVRKTSVARLEELGDCPLQIDEIYGGGRAAFMDGSASLELGCISGLDEIYGGSERADIGKDVVLTITSGKYDKVFGGNNVSGHIFGSITVNIEQTGCLPIEIGELYGGGNLAPYSVYGYDGNDLNYELQTGSTAYADPQINIKSFKSIGTVYGGGYKAEMVGNPHININVVKGWTNGEYKGTEPEEEDDYAEYKDTPKNMPETGLIGTVFGGGNDADVVGQTFVNIGTESYVTVHDVTKDVYNIIKNGRSDISNPQFTESDNGSTTKNLTITVQGATITGNVYGGGNNANVTQGTNITIGQ